MMKGTRLRQEEVHIHQDEQYSDEDDTVMEESTQPLEESGCMRSDSSEDEEIEESVAEDIARFESTFKNINKRFRLINRIGEGMPLRPSSLKPYLS